MTQTNATSSSGGRRPAVDLRRSTSAGVDRIPLYIQVTEWTRVRTLVRTASTNCLLTRGCAHRRSSTHAVYILLSLSKSYMEKSSSLLTSLTAHARRYTPYVASSLLRSKGHLVMCESPPLPRPTPPSAAAGRRPICCRPRRRCPSDRRSARERLCTCTTLSVTAMAPPSPLAVRRNSMAAVAERGGTRQLLST